MTWKGEVESLHIGPERGKPLHSVNEVVAVAGKGLQGDRKFKEDNEPGREITLIESEALEALRRDYDFNLSEGEDRRNVVIKGAALNHLVGREFRVGEVRLEGIKLCEPCVYLEGLTQRPGLREALLHRGGLRARIVEGGRIRVGDAVAEA